MLNGEILPTASPCLFSDNRGLKFGDSFSHVIRGNSSKAFLLKQNFEFIVHAMSKMKMEKPVLFKKPVFATDIELLLQKNRIYKGFVAYVTVFRNASTDKIVKDNSVSIMIVVEKLTEEWFVLNKRGLRLDVIKSFIVPEFIISNNISPVLSEEYFFNDQDVAKADNARALTDDNKILLRTLDSDLFFVKDDKIIIPKRNGLDSISIFSWFLNSLAKDLGFQIYKADVTEDDLVDFDEIFIANPADGLSWVLAYNDKRYFHRVSEKLLTELNDNLQMNL
jgi:branched-chain amino acid aminotransferase